ncbi:hypothetical protein [Flavobacterium sp.]|uniref:hypothetical protein n=1 Tax=Flavobacterium sp. TaxID=239 RepID=UPI0025E723B0|nr:hypothetical protein [Flavobacterium sp.]
MNTSPKALLFKELQDRIKTEASEIVWINQNLAQYLNDEKRKAMIFPCVLIDFPNTDYTALQGDIQMGNATIMVTLFFDIWNQTYHVAPNQTIEDGLSYFDIEQKIYSCLQGWAASFTQPLVRTNSKNQNINDLGLRVIELTFTTAYEDWTNNEDNYVGLGLNT